MNAPNQHTGENVSTGTPIHAISSGILGYVAPASPSDADDDQNKFLVWSVLQCTNRWFPVEAPFVVWDNLSCFFQKDQLKIEYRCRASDESDAWNKSKPILTGYVSLIATMGIPIELVATTNSFVRPAADAHRAGIVRVLEIGSGFETRQPRQILAELNAINPSQVLTRLKVGDIPNLELAFEWVQMSYLAAEPKTGFLAAWTSMEVLAGGIEKSQRSPNYLRVSGIQRAMKKYAFDPPEDLGRLYGVRGGIVHSGGPAPSALNVTRIRDVALEFILQACESRNGSS